VKKCTVTKFAYKMSVKHLLRNIYGTRSLINNFKSSVNRDEPVAIEEYYIIHIETLGKQNFAKIVGLYFLC